MKRFVRATVLSLSTLLALFARAQFAPQQVLREGLLTQNHRGNFVASAFAPDGSLYLLLDAGDGIRVLKTDSTASASKSSYISGLRVGAPHPSHRHPGAVLCSKLLRRPPPADATCSITITYAPVYELAPASSASPARFDTGLLTIESDAVSSPDTISLAATASAVTSAQLSTGAIGSYSLSSGSLTFETTQVGNISPSQTVTPTNTGSTTLHIAPILAPVDFTASSTCTTLLPSRTCTLSIQFTPGDQPTRPLRTATLEISSDAADALEFVTLLGNSTPAPLTLTPTSLDFGNVDISQSAELPVSVTNTSSSPVTFGSITTAAPFDAANGTCPAPGAQLAAGAQCTISIRFTPSAAGSQSGTLSLPSSATQLPLTVALTGTGVNTTPSPSSFILSVNGSSAASVTTATGQPATFTLAAAATNGYSGPVALTCDPLSSVPYATCSLLASTLTLANNTQTSTATITTLTSSPHASQRLAGILLLPLAFVTILARKRRRIAGSLLVLVLASAALSLNGCGGSSPSQTTQANVLYTPPGTYQWRVTANSTSGPTLSSSVVLTVTIR